MKISNFSRRPLQVSGLALVLGAALTLNASVPVQARPKMMMRSDIGVAKAENIARVYVGRGAYIVRSEGIHNGSYRIHVHKNGVARHVFVNARTGRVVKVRVLSVVADRREDSR